MPKSNFCVGLSYGAPPTQFGCKRLISVEEPEFFKILFSQKSQLHQMATKNTRKRYNAKDTQRMLNYCPASPTFHSVSLYLLVFQKTELFVFPQRLQWGI